MAEWVVSLHLTKDVDVRHGVEENWWLSEFQLLFAEDTSSFFIALALIFSTNSAHRDHSMYRWNPSLFMTLKITPSILYGINPNYVTLIILSAELRRQGTSVNTLELFPPVCIPTRWYTYVLVVSHSKINFIFCKSVLIDFRQIIIIFKKIWSCKQVIKTIITYWVYH